MIKNQKRTTSAEDDYILTGVSYTTPTVTKTPTNKTNKNMVLTIQKRNFWKEETETDTPTATITIPLSDYALRTYLEENYYNKTAIDGFIEQYKIKVVVLESVNNLPKSGDSRYADTSYLFLARHIHDVDSSSQKDYFDEYIWNDDKSDYERIGNTDIDLTPYMKIADFNTWVSETLNPQITTINNAITQLQNNKEDISNKVTSLSSSSKDTQYPSAKLLYNQLALKENNSNKVTSINSSSTDTQYPSAKLLYNQLALKENNSNKVTSINSSSTDAQYPSAKLLYDQLKLKENTSNKTTTINANSTDIQYPTALAVYTELSSKLNKTWVSETLNPQITTINNTITQLQNNKEDVSNKVTSLSASSKDTQYPSAKLVYDQLKLKENNSNKVISIDSSSTDTQYPSAKLLYNQLALKENNSNKVTSIDSSSTDTQYPSAKLLYDQLVLKEDISNKTNTIDEDSTHNQYPTAKAVYTELSSKLNKVDAFSGNYNDLINKPNIPTKTTDLNNDAGFITLSDIPTDSGSESGLQVYVVDNESKATVDGIYIVSPENHSDDVYSLSLSANENIVSIGESITFQAILKKNNEPVPYENLLLVVEDTKIGAITDKNGVATFTYEGQGYGVVDASVFYNVFLQEIFVIYDVLKIYSAIADYYQTSTSDLSLSNEVFSKTTGNVMPLNPLTSTRYFTDPITIEFDLITTNTLTFQIGESTNAFNTRLNYMGAVDGSHIKIVYDGSKIIPYVDGVEKTSYIVEWSHTTRYYINFYNSGAWKNLIIY